MNVYFDLDDTLVRSGDLTPIATANKMVKSALDSGHSLSVLTHSLKRRADFKIQRCYPDTFKRVIAREDYCNEVFHQAQFGLTICQLEPISINVDPYSVLVDDLQPTHEITIAKMKFLGITKDRLFSFNAYDHLASEKFIQFLLDRSVMCDIVTES